jgi:hypothetical protein
MLTTQEIQLIVGEAKQAAAEAAENYFQEKLGGQDRFACGFAWIEIVSLNGEKIKGNTRIGKAMSAAGISKRDYGNRSYMIWNPSGHRCQNVDTKHAGAVAAANVFQKYGFDAFANHRLD